jgi:hypothetical protein
MTELEAPRKRQIRLPGVRREIVHKVKVNPDQEARLVAKAGERGITVSRLLVESALAGGADAAAAKAQLAGELYRITRVVGKVGVNVNQIARATNATLEEQPSTRAAMDAIVRLTERLELFLADVEGGGQ